MKLKNTKNQEGETRFEFVRSKLRYLKKYLLPT